MSKEVMEVIHGRHVRYDVIRDRKPWSTSHYVRTSDGKWHGSFSGLDKAVQWARERALRQ
jgi:hypothetical protein